MKKYLYIFLFLLSSSYTDARSYWQQEVHTRIEVTLDDQQHLLRGYIEMEYINHSPDTLHYLYMHLWPNAYLHDHTPYARQQYRFGTTGFYYAKPKDRGYIDSLSFRIGRHEVLHFIQEGSPDIARIDLPEMLLPGERIKISTPFRVKIPKTFSRLGHNGQAYFISQWYPKPAVYDREGWHPMSYLDIGEFYSEFGSYDVSVTLPENYIVLATGNLEDKKEQDFLDSLSRIIPEPERAQKTTRKADDLFPPSSPVTKTIRFTEDRIHDFAWFADKRWSVKKDTIKIADKDTAVTVWAAFYPAYSNGNTLLYGMKAAVRYYSAHIGPYPYHTIKMVTGNIEAGGGMEYPTIALIDKNQSNDIVTVIHEAGHNWFYGILGSNERQHPWMDEGLNSHYENRSVRSHFRNTALPVKARYRMPPDKLPLAQLQATAMDQPGDLPSIQYRHFNYGIDVYYKNALLFQWLEHYTGESAWENAIKDYYENWKFKHPSPDDFRKALERHTEKSLDWFFNGAFSSAARTDFAVKNVRTEKDGINVRLQNNSRISLPAIVEVYQKDSLLATAVTAPFTGTTHTFIPAGPSEWTSVRISDKTADTKPQNNVYRKNGLFKRSGLRMGLLFGMNDRDRESIWLAPAVGYNAYDGIQAGILLHNVATIPENRFRFILSPLYGFSSGSLHGAGSVGYIWYPTGIFREILLQADVKQFSYNKTSVNIPQTKYAGYLKIAPSLHFTFREKDPHSSVTRVLSLKAFHIREQSFLFHQDTVDLLYKPGLTAETQLYGQVKYSHENQRTFNPFRYQAEIHGGKSFLKMQVEGNLRIDYHAPKKSFYVRAYAGKLWTYGRDFSVSRYYLNSTFTGINDYLYEDTYIGRTEQDGLGAKQVSIREGGLKMPTPYYANPLGRSDNWLASVNLKTDLPLGKLPLRLYLDVSSFADAAKLNPSGNKILYSGGVELHLADVLHIYIPLVMSKDYQDYIKSILGKNSFSKTITFSLDLQQFQWLKTGDRLFKKTMQ